MFAQLQSGKGEKVSELQELSLIEHFFFWFRQGMISISPPPQAKGGKYSNNSSRNSLKPYSENDYCQNSLGGHHRLENRIKNAFKFIKKKKKSDLPVVHHPTKADPQGGAAPMSILRKFWTCKKSKRGKTDGTNT